MDSLPFAIVDGIPVLVGLDTDGTLFGMTVPGGELASFEPDEAIGFVNTDPAAVYFGAAMDVQSAALPIAAAPKQRKPTPRYTPPRPGSLPA